MKERREMICRLWLERNEKIFYKTEGGMEKIDKEKPFYPLKHIN